MSDPFPGFSFASPKKRERRIYENCEPCIGAESPSIIEVDLKLLNAALRGDWSWAYEHKDRNNDTFNPVRYDRMLKAVQQGETVPTPWLYFQKGRTCVMDGRHRLYVMIDLDYTHAKVTVADRDLAVLSTLIDGHD